MNNDLSYKTFSLIIYVPKNLIDCLNQVRVLTTIGQSGPEISWSLGDCSSNQTLGDKQSNTTFCCLNYGNHNLNCTNGGNGGFIEIQGKKYCEDTIEDGTLSMKVAIKGMFKYHSYNQREF